MSSRLIAVTGASGFVGRHVVATLLRQNVEVVAVTRNAQRLHGGAVRVVELDIGTASTDAYDRLGRPDALIHLAWDGLPNYKALHHFETELPRQYAFLKRLIECGLPALQVIGTCFEYGLQSGGLVEDVEVRPVTPYGHAKNALRCQLEYLKSIHPFRMTWARLFYLYGEGQAEGSLWPQLRQAAERGDAHFNMSGGEQLRDYMPVTEVASHLVSLAMANKDVGLVNVCSGNPISVRKLVEGWIEQNGWSITPNLGYYPYPNYEPMAFWGDRSKLDGLLNPK